MNKKNKKPDNKVLNTILSNIFIWIVIVVVAFSIASNLPNDILVIDEVFGAGDKDFIEKATNRMMNMIDTSNIVVFASHDNELLRSFCTHVLWLDGGKIQFFGDIHEGLKMYLKN